jgi:hypothetical protein
MPKWWEDPIGVVEQTGQRFFNTVSQEATNFVNSDVGRLIIAYELPGIGEALGNELLAQGLVASEYATAAGTAIASVGIQTAQGVPLDKAIENATINAVVNTGSNAVAKDLNNILGSANAANIVSSIGGSIAKTALAGGSSDDMLKNARAALLGSSLTAGTGSSEIGRAAAGYLQGGVMGAAGAVASALGEQEAALKRDYNKLQETQSAVDQINKEEQRLVNDINKLYYFDSTGNFFSIPQAEQAIAFQANQYKEYVAKFKELTANGSIQNNQFIKNDGTNATQEYNSIANLINDYKSTVDLLTKDLSKFKSNFIDPLETKKQTLLSDIQSTANQLNSDLQAYTETYSKFEQGQAPEVSKDDVIKALVSTGGIKNADDVSTIKGQKILDVAMSYADPIAAVNNSLFDILSKADGWKDFAQEKEARYKGIYTPEKWATYQQQQADQEAIIKQAGIDKIPKPGPGTNVAAVDTGTVTDVGGGPPFKVDVSGTPKFAETAGEYKPPAGYRLLSRDNPEDVALSQQQGVTATTDPATGEMYWLVPETVTTPPEANVSPTDVSNVSVGNVTITQPAAGGDTSNVSNVTAGNVTIDTTPTNNVSSNVSNVTIGDQNILDLLNASNVTSNVSNVTTGNVTIGNVTQDNVISNIANVTQGNVTTGDITQGNVTSNVANVTTGNVTTGNVTQDNVVSDVSNVATGNVTTGDTNVANVTSNVSNVTISGGGVNNAGNADQQIIDLTGIGNVASGNVTIDTSGDNNVAPNNAVSNVTPDLYKPELAIFGGVSPAVGRTTQLGTVLQAPFFPGSSPTTGLTSYRGAGEIEGPETGGKRKNVWNEASLRLKDALGL